MSIDIVPEVLAALEDQARLNKLESLLREGFDLVSDVQDPERPHYFLQREDDEVFGGPGNLRLVIDASRAAK